MPNSKLHYTPRQMETLTDKTSHWTKVIMNIKCPAFVLVVNSKHYQLSKFSQLSKCKSMGTTAALPHFMTGMRCGGWHRGPTNVPVLRMDGLAMTSWHYGDFSRHIWLQSVVLLIETLYNVIESIIFIMPTEKEGDKLLCSHRNGMAQVPES